MAIIWSKEVGDKLYQVRTAGQSVRLYKDGVFHSQWNPARPLAGGVWDLLFIPALFSTQSVARVLVLGVGGGACLRLYRQLLQADEVVGVELDPVHLQVARKFFGLTDAGVTLECADAIDWVANYRGAKFDVVVEDLFTECDGEPVRVAEATAAWFASLLGMLNPDGILIINFEDARQMRQSIENYEKAAGKPVLAYQFSQPSYGNCVCAFLSSDEKPAALRRRLEAIMASYPAARQSAQRFRVRRVVSEMTNRVKQLQHRKM